MGGWGGKGGCWDGKAGGCSHRWGAGVGRWGGWHGTQRKHSSHLESKFRSQTVPHSPENSYNFLQFIFMEKVLICSFKDTL